MPPDAPCCARTPACVFALLLLLLATCHLPVLAIIETELDGDFTNTPDHQAHAKPGGPYSATDWNGDGLEVITLDATDSHSHYFDFGPPSVSGIIVSYVWSSVYTGATLLDSKSPYFKANFFEGITMLKLVVTDNTGNKAEGYTYVEVLKPSSGMASAPSIQSISPDYGPTFGGNTVTITGANFYNNLVVMFGSVPVVPTDIIDTEMKVLVPPSNGQGYVACTAKSDFGSSPDSVQYEYQKTAADAPVHFEETTLKNKDGSIFAVTEITSLKMGPDGLFYAGSLDGYIYVLKVDMNMVVQSSCKSPSAGSGRSILGLAFNPNDADLVKIYVSTSTLFWRTKETGESWDNGKIEQWVKNSDNDCVAYSKTIASGLPVSNHDHGVNGLEFDNDGNLLVAVGGSTNAGVHTQEDGIGGLPESPLSGAVIKLELSLGAAFDGKITYDGYDYPETADVASGSVSVFAAGTRNVFGITRHSNGEFYALDNGPNNGFGYGANGCESAGDQAAFGDKLLHLEAGAFYGHPNWNRGRTDPRQCAWVRGDSPDKGKAFKAPIAILDSSTDGIMEYTANTFNSKLHGSLLMSKLSWKGPGTLYRAELDPSGNKLVHKPEELYEDSGLTMAMSPYGDIMMPKIKQAKILVLRPVEPKPALLHITAVSPRRGPAKGGNMVMVTGHGLVSGVSIIFGKTPCTSYNRWAADGTSVWCSVKAGAPGAKIPVFAKAGSSASVPSGKGEYEYMNS